MADEEGKAEEAEEGKEGKAEEGKEEVKDAGKEPAKEPDKKETPKEAPKEDAKEKASAGGGATNKAVKTKKNQFAMNRLLLMLMDVKPEALCAETINDLKKVYALLVNIHRNYKG